MSKRDKVVNANKQKRNTVKDGDTQKDVAGPTAKARVWANVQKLPGGGKLTEARRNLPSGPLGGSGRKTNVSRSS